MFETELAVKKPNRGCQDSEYWTKHLYLPAGVLWEIIDLNFCLVVHPNGDLWTVHHGLLADRDASLHKKQTSDSQYIFKSPPSRLSCSCHEHVVGLQVGAETSRFLKYM